MHILFDIIEIVDVRTASKTSFIFCINSVSTGEFKNVNLTQILIKKSKEKNDQTKTKTPTDQRANNTRILNKILCRGVHKFKMKNAKLIRYLQLTLSVEKSILADHQNVRVGSSSSTGVLKGRWLAHAIIQGGGQMMHLSISYIYVNMFYKNID